MEAAAVLAPVTRRFAGMDGGEFREALEKLTTAEQQWKELAIAQVETETISPEQGLGIISAVTATLFAWNEFHRQLTPADVVSLMGTSSRN